jgi:riboflavin synthase alpha subunit
MLGGSSSTRLRASARVLIEIGENTGSTNRGRYACRMFTGIVREVATVAVFDGVRLVLEAPESAVGADVGDSVSVAGVCLTVVESSDGHLGFDVVPETLARTTLGQLEPGDVVNLEPPLRLGDPLGGHVVQGHVDAVGRVRSVADEETGRRVWIDAPDSVLGYCIEKGSVAVDGVSLTVAGLDDDGFEVALVPHTLAATTLRGLTMADAVNLEADVLAKIVGRLLPARLP